MTQEEFFYQCMDVIEHWLNGNRNLSDLREVTDKLYNEVTKPHWISIKDELPPKRPNREQSKNVLVRTNSGRAKIEYYDYGNDVIKEWWEYNITHWTPLPQEPSSSEFPNNCEKGGNQ